MRETKFIEQNKDKWHRFEQQMEEDLRDPESLKDLFIEITDDLSYSRTFYPNRSVRVYLNSLAQRIFFRLYRGRSAPGRRLLSFWLDELPRVIYEARRDFLLSFLVFLLAFGIGMLSSAMEPQFVRSILGDAYVDQTIQNIESGDPMAIYKDRDRLGMSVGITMNNLYVAILTFVLGILAGVGTIALLLRNGIMIGSFQYFFIERDLFWESFLTVWLHGTLEISAIIIAGAAGITMGRGLAFPGTYTRMQAFQRSARRGLKILIGIVPIIILAGFIEGYLTRHTETPDVIRGVFIAVCAFFVVMYFIWYPRFRARMDFDEHRTPPDLPPDASLEIEYDRIKSSGDIFSDVFLLLRRYGRRLIGWSAGLGLLYTGTIYLTTTNSAEEVFFYPNQAFGKLQVLDRFFFNDAHSWMPLVMGLCLCLLATSVGGIVRTDRNGAISRGEWWRRMAMMTMPVAVALIVIWTRNWFTFFLLVFIMPGPLLYMAVQQYFGGSLTKAYQRTLHLIQGTYGRALGLLLMLLMIGFIFYTLLDTAILLFYLDFINLVVYLPPDQMDLLMILLETVLTTTMLFFCLSLILLGFQLLVFSNEEIRNASTLREQIKSISVERRIRGLLKE